ncbi:MAG: ATP-grasp domain-containing protein [Bdellovibrionales bacterium]|nr:ATP-grasp domain-containing protein [Bdellovibrionales bacterium]
MQNINRLAIANRGEVAVRIIRACQELGIESVLLHSEPDTYTRAYRLADKTICIGGAASSDSYLNIQATINGAIAGGADAIHPGFGFLSENSEFASECEKAGIIFVGPSPKAIADMGDKVTAREIVSKAGVPVVPGYQGEDQSQIKLAAEAEKIGFPLIIKAANGGGGRGIKVAMTSGDFAEQLESAKRESKSAFGSDRVFLEKYIQDGKHIEFQVFGDSHGNYVHLFERECSVQRRHQKIIEEAQSPSLNPEIREQMSKSAVEAARAVDYTGAGTVEFLFKGGKYYFLEMNTRLQVEHPVTEEVLGVDLVKAQIQVAQGGKLPWEQEDLKPRGHAIECRLYAEDPFMNGVPSTGKILGLKWPEGRGRRFEYGFDADDIVSSYYDSMIAKIIVFDETREKCIDKTLKVLEESVVFGVKTNIEYLKAILTHDDFRSGKMTTGFIAKYFPEGLKESENSKETLQFIEQAQRELSSSVFGPSTDRASGARAFLEGWRNT